MPARESCPEPHVHDEQEEEQTGCTKEPGKKVEGQRRVDPNYTGSCWVIYYGDRAILGDELIGNRATECDRQGHTPFSSSLTRDFNNVSRCWRRLATRVRIDNRCIKNLNNSCSYPHRFSHKQISLNRAHDSN